MESRMVSLIPRVLRAHTLSIESKMILLSLVVNSGEATSLRNWAIALRISDNTLKSALDDLLALECITKEYKKTSSPRGEIKYFVQVEKTEKLVKSKITQGENKRSIFGGAIEAFVKEAFGHRLNTPRSERDRKCELLPVNLILFAIFLVHSDELGIVDNLSKADLKKLTGYSADKLNSQLKKLVRIGVLSLRVSGFSKSLLVGKVKSMYFLMLTHDAFTVCNYEMIQHSDVTRGIERRIFIDSIDDFENSIFDKKLFGKFSDEFLSFFFESLRGVFLKMSYKEALYIQAKSEHLIALFLSQNELDISSISELPLEKKLLNWLNERANIFPKISVVMDNVKGGEVDKKNSDDAELALINIVISHALIKFLSFFKTVKLVDVIEEGSKLSSDIILRFVQVNGGGVSNNPGSPFVKLEKYKNRGSRHIN